MYANWLFMCPFILRLYSDAENGSLTFHFSRLSPAAETSQKWQAKQRSILLRCIESVHLQNNSILVMSSRMLDTNLQNSNLYDKYLPCRLATGATQNGPKYSCSKKY